MLPLFSSSQSLLPPPHIWTIGRTRFLWAGWGSCSKVGQLPPCESDHCSVFCSVGFRCSQSMNVAVGYNAQHQTCWVWKIFTVFICVGLSVCFAHIKKKHAQMLVVELNVFVLLLVTGRPHPSYLYFWYAYRLGGGLDLESLELWRGGAARPKTLIGATFKTL